MSFSAAVPAKIINGPAQIGPIGPTGAASADASGFAFGNVLLASAPGDTYEPNSEENEPGAEAIPPDDSLQGPAVASPLIPVVVNADVLLLPIEPPPERGVDGGQSTPVETEHHESAVFPAVVTALQPEAASEPPTHDPAAEIAVEEHAPPVQPRSFISQQAEDAPAARWGSPLADRAVSGRAVDDFADSGFDAARSSFRPAPLSGDDARILTDARIADALPAATVAANAPPGAETSIDTGVALPGAAGTKEASPPAITVVASRQTADGSIELRLDPPELGSVSIDLVTDETGAVTAVVNADRAETLDLLRRHIDHFKGELARNGFGEVDVTFGGGRQGGDEPPPRARAQHHWTHHASAAFDDYAAFALGEGFDVIA